MCSVLISPQFVTFINTKDYVINYDSPREIIVQYIVDRKVRVTTKDWVALFPRGCDFTIPPALDLMITFQFVLGPPISDEERRYNMQFSLIGVKNLKAQQEYQFAYYNSRSEVLGVSDVFRILEACPQVEVPKLALRISPERNNNEGEEIGVEKGAKWNQRKYRRNKQNLWAIHDRVSGQRNELETNVEVDKYINKYTKNKQGFINKVHQRAICDSSSDSQPQPLSPKVNTYCSNCHRVPALLSKQKDLYSQVKNLAEENNDLKKEANQLRELLELEQTANQTLSVKLMLYDRHWMLYYQDRVVVADQAPPGLMTVRNLPTVARQGIFHHSDEKIKLGSSLKLKAIIGYQEQKIRFLTEKLEELQAGNVQKVTALIKDLESIDIREKEFGDEDAEAIENNY